MNRNIDNPPAYSDEYRFADQEIMLKVLGPRSQNIAVLERELHLSMGQRGLSVFMQGEVDTVGAGLKLVDQLVRASRNGRVFSEIDLVRGSRILRENPEAELDAIFNEVVYVTSSKRLITPKGLAQKEYVEALKESDLTFSIGPAGTGKTYLAVAVAVSRLMKKKCRRIVLARPAVEAGERLGFLPGDLAEKINPYLRPLYDALDDMLGSEKTQALIAQDQIEIAPPSVHERPYSERLLCNTRRGPEHHATTNEDVSHQAGILLHGRGDWRCESNRFTGKHSIWTGGRRTHPPRYTGYIVCKIHRNGRGTPSTGTRDNQGLR